MNKQLWNDERAVSPVIAVILMVAITVVLAATVFVLVSDIGNTTNKPAPAVAYGNNEVLDRIEVSSGAQDADWNRIGIKTDATGLRFVKNGNAIATSPLLTTGTESTISATSAPTVAGDYLDFCGTTALTNVVITLRDIPANSVVWSGTLNSIAAC